MKPWKPFLVGLIATAQLALAGAAWAGPASAGPARPTRRSSPCPAEAA